jgi:calcineurin-like phosphoesterase family protein
MRRTALVSSLTLLALVVTLARSIEPRARAVTAIPRIAAVGDIACKNPPAMNRSVCQYDDVAAAIGAGNYDKVLLLGDIQYEAGVYQDFVENFDVYFGDLLPTTAPAPGNHEYGDPGAAGYFRYFGPLAPASFYSFDLGDWHIVSLDSTICGAGGLACLAGSPQHSWLADDLERSDALCTLAFWHHPRWDWLKYQNADWTNGYELLRSKPLWDLLYTHDADLVLTGHNHNYSRWKPADPQGRFDPDRGLTQFVVGTGGRNLNDFGNFHTRPEIFARGQSKAFGFLDLRLRPTGWDYQWISADGQPAFTDQGSGSCH